MIQHLSCLAPRASLDIRIVPFPFLEIALPYKFSKDTLKLCQPYFVYKSLCSLGSVLKKHCAQCAGTDAGPLTYHDRCGRVQALILEENRRKILVCKQHLHCSTGNCVTRSDVKVHAKQRLKKSRYTVPKIEAKRSRLKPWKVKCNVEVQVNLHSHMPVDISAME